MKELDVAKSFVMKILSNNGEPTPDGVYDMFEINRGNNEVLLQHLEAIISIINKAIEQIKEGEKDDKINF